MSARWHLGKMLFEVAHRMRRMDLKGCVLNMHPEDVAHMATHDYARETFLTVPPSMCGVTIIKNPIMIEGTACLTEKGVIIAQVSLDDGHSAQLFAWKPDGWIESSGLGPWAREVKNGTSGCD